MAPTPRSGAVIGLIVGSASQTLFIAHENGKWLSVKKTVKLKQVFQADKWLACLHVHSKPRKYLLFSYLKGR
jgi:hypothetical protein